jgi:subtilisin family serine protease
MPQEDPMTRQFALPLSLVALALLSACADGTNGSIAAPERGIAPLLAAAPHAEVIRDRYIVVFRDDVGDAAQLAKRLAAAHGGTLHYSYQHALKGFAATLPARGVEGLRHNPQVAFIQHDQAARTTAVTQTSAPWGLDRIDAELGLDQTYTYTYTGAGVKVYVIDSGIDVTHPQFGGRATLGMDACYGGECFAGDNYGHGTRVAGVIGSTTYGVAKGASLVSVRVLNGAGAGSASSAMQGVDWVTAQKQAQPTTPMVANVSLLFAPDAALDAAVRSSISAGVTYVVGSGNSGAAAADSSNACNWSPQRVTEALTVGAVTRGDYLATFSNVGPCVDLYAPGQDIRTTNAGGTITSLGVRGTSFSAPFVAGLAAMYLQPYWASSAADVHNAVVYWSNRDKVIGLGTGSHNRLLYTRFDLGSSGRIPGCCR